MLSASMPEQVGVLSRAGIDQFIVMSIPAPERTWNPFWRFLFELESFRLWLPLTIAPHAPSAYQRRRRFARQIWNGFKRVFASFGSGAEHLGGEISSSHSRAKSPLVPPAAR